MPEIARYYGIVIKMYFIKGEHNPPHIHALYNECMGEIDIQTLEMIAGDLPKKALSMVKEWVKDNQDELIKMWNEQNFRKLPPLE